MYYIQDFPFFLYLVGWSCLARAFEVAFRA